MASPHDEFFKTVFEDPRHVADLVRLALPLEAVHNLDLGSIRLVPGSLVEPELRELYSDLLFEANVSGRRSLIYLLFEHKSSPDHLTLLQLYRYMGAIWGRHTAKSTGSLPQIVPIVVYHGARPWQAPRSFSDYFADRTPAFDPVGPELRPLFLDLSQVADTLLARVSPSVRAAVLALRHAFKPAAADVSAILNPKITEITTEAARQFFVAIGTYLMRTSTGEERKAILSLVTSPPAQEVVMTIAEELQQEGALRRSKEVLTRLLSKKFGLTDAERSLIAGTNDPDRLTAALDEFVFAQGKEQVLERLKS